MFKEQIRFLFDAGKPFSPVVDIKGAREAQSASQVPSSRQSLGKICGAKAKYKRFQYENNFIA